MQLACCLIVCESRNKNALYFRFIQRSVQSLVNVNFVFPITINSQPRAMIQLLLCSLLAMPRLCNYLCRWQWLSSALADSLQYIIIVWMYKSSVHSFRILSRDASTGFDDFPIIFWVDINELLTKHYIGIILKGNHFSFSNLHKTIGYLQQAVTSELR